MSRPSRAEGHLLRLAAWRIRRLCVGRPPCTLPRITMPIMDAPHAMRRHVTDCSPLPRPPKGIDDPYEAPLEPEVVLPAAGPDGRPLLPQDHAAALLALLADRGLIRLIRAAAAPAVANGGGGAAASADGGAGPGDGEH